MPLSTPTSRGNGSVLLVRFLEGIVQSGNLTVVDHKGGTHRIGDGTGTPITMRVDDRWFGLHLLCSPSLATAEAYMDGRLTLENGSLYDLLALVAANMNRTAPRKSETLRRWGGILLRRFMQYNPIGRAQRNVAHHYDLSGDLYDLFLDADKQYSCAYFVQSDDDLETAQANKKRHIAAKLLLHRNHRVLDIGSGWGGLALHLAREWGAIVDGVTLSEEQHGVASQRAAEQGLAKKVQFALKDYRHVDGPYDRVVSVGMFEHVGVGHYGEFFNKIRGLLNKHGVALVHTIGRTDGPGVTDPFIRRYIFPGGYIPALSEVIPEIERAGLVVTDVEVLRLHYADTLRHWRRRFMANWDRAKALYDERFCRMWEFYLAGSEVAFRHMGMVVFQIQLACDQTSVPLTRDYIAELENTPVPRKSAAA